MYSIETIQKLNENAVAKEHSTIVKQSADQNSVDASSGQEEYAKNDARVLSQDLCISADSQGGPV